MRSLKGGAPQAGHFNAGWLTGGGSLTIEGTSDGIHGNDSVRFYDANVTITAQKDGIQANEAVKGMQAVLNIEAGEEV